MDPAVVSFGQRVREARLARGWTQEDLSRETGLATVQVSRIERGVREVRFTTVLRLLEAFDMAPNDLLCGLPPRGALRAPLRRRAKPVRGGP